jgi:carbon monoxide dehydrogenase subunit G
MKMSGEQTLNAPREAVWAALNDPEVLKESIPGCDSLTRTEDGGFEAVVQAKVGPVKAKFKGKVTLTDIDPPNGYRISGEGTGGAAGFAKGGATIKLTEPAPGQTLLSYDVDASVGGKLAQIGQRLVDGTARKMADDFFQRFSARFGPVVPTGAPADAAATDAAAAEASATETERRQMNPMLWVIVLGLAAALLIYLANR